ncbi:MAG: hypothetical protein U0572_13645 [Phycisphaerales bacterium]
MFGAHSLRRGADGGVGGCPPSSISLRKDVRRRWPGVTFVANDGKFISTFQAGKGMSTPPSDGVIALQSSKEWAPKLPPGEYFVVPGYFVYNADQAIVLQMLSKEIDLSKSDIPRVIVREFDANTFAIDLAKAHEAIQRAAASNGISP